MGRNTSSLRAALSRYSDRIRRIIDLLPADEKIFFEEFLRDIDTTFSLLGHVGVEDPLEIIVIHLMRRIAQLEKRHLAK
ncbi:MAG: hypothetical protein ACP5I7_07615 [Sulfolobales archaeon]|jgi:hypothetical protein